MRYTSWAITAAILASGLITSGGCKQESAPPASPAAPESAAPTEPATTTPAAKPAAPTPAEIPSPNAAPAATATGDTTPLELTGLTLQVPAGWTVMEVKDSPMAPKAAFTLPAVEGETVPCTVRITYFPNMSDMENLVDANLQRWLGQVRRTDGAPSTREDATITTMTGQGTKLTVLDITGIVGNTMMGSHTAGAPIEQMVAAIVEHDQGPHFIKVQGPPASVAAHRAAIDAFLQSASAK